MPRKRLKKAEAALIEAALADPWDACLPLVHELERITLEAAASVPMDLRYEFCHAMINRIGQEFFDEMDLKLVMQDTPPWR